MKIIGIIAEYNPFHLGHLYQINEIKKIYPDSIIISIVSSCFTERGDVSIINKWNKTEIQLNNNIDIVLELPYVYATQSSDIFAKGALEILNKFQIDILCFGSELNDINQLTDLAKCQINNKKYNKIVKDYLDKGLNYPTATSKALKDILGYTINTPNDLLALSYIKEIIKNEYQIKPMSIKRTNNYHEKVIKSNIIPASLIRNRLLKRKSIKRFIPKNTKKYLYKNLSINNYFPYLKYQIINHKNNLKQFVTVDEGIENRILKYIDTSNSWAELVNNIKTKRYTYNKINRMLLHILIGYTKEDNKVLKIDYIRILGFNNKGKKYLNKIKKEIDVSIITNYKKNISKYLDLEFKANYIYSLPIDNKLIEMEYKQKPIIK